MEWLLDGHLRSAMLRGAFGRKQGRRPATRVFSELAAAHSSWFKLEDQGMVRCPIFRVKHRSCYHNPF